MKKKSHLLIATRYTIHYQSEYDECYQWLQHIRTVHSFLNTDILCHQRWGSLFFFLMGEKQYVLCTIESNTYKPSSCGAHRSPLCGVLALKHRQSSEGAKSGELKDFKFTFLDISHYYCRHVGWRGWGSVLLSSSHIIICVFFPLSVSEISIEGLCNSVTLFKVSHWQHICYIPKNGGHHLTCGSIWSVFGACVWSMVRNCCRSLQ